MKHTNQLGEDRRASKARLFALGVLGMVIIIVSTAFILTNSTSAPTATEQTETTTPETKLETTMFFEPGTLQIQPDTTQTVGLWVDSKDTVLNAVQAVINYAPEQIEITNIDYSGSVFDIKAEETKQPGVLQIGRATFSRVTGKQLIASLTLSVKATDNTAVLSLQEGSLALTADTNVNALSDRQSLTITIEGSQQ